MKDFGGGEILYRACLSWVIGSKTRSEQMFSEVPPDSGHPCEFSL